MNHRDPTIHFYKEQLPEAELKHNILTAQCPFCTQAGRDKPGNLVVFLHPESYFHGYYRCLDRCSAGGFPLHFARKLHINMRLVPGFDPDREYIVSQVNYPVKNINHELLDFMDKLTDELVQYFAEMAITRDVLKEMQVGYNGRYLVFPYIQEDGNCYSAVASIRTDPMIPSGTVMKNSSMIRSEFLTAGRFCAVKTAA